eukprot:3664035-Amphidinium_carterae.2
MMKPLKLRSCWGWRMRKNPHDRMGKRPSKPEPPRGASNSKMERRLALRIAHGSKSAHARG